LHTSVFVTMHTLSACAGQPETNTGASHTPALQTLALARRLGQGEAQTIFHLLKAARALYEVREVSFAVNAAQRQHVAELLVEAFLNGHCRAITRAPHGQSRPRIIVAIRVAEEVHRVAEFCFHPVFRLDQLAL